MPLILWYIVEAVDIRHKPCPEWPPNRATIATISMPLLGDFSTVAKLAFLAPADDSDGDENHGNFFKMYLCDY